MEQNKADLELQEIRDTETKEENLNEEMNLQQESVEREEALEEQKMVNLDVKVLELKVEDEGLIQLMKFDLENNKSEEAGISEAQIKTHLDLKFPDVREGEAELFSQLLKLSNHLETNLGDEGGAPEK